jgi:hypothetical protein
MLSFMPFMVQKKLYVLLYALYAFMVQIKLYALLYALYAFVVQNIFMSLW